MPLDLSNDARGWIMCLASAAACIFGAGLIGADLLMRKLPGWHDFKIQDSDQFLAACFSLSFGVMLFSSLLDMYPSACSELRKGGLSDSATTWIVLALFASGYIGIGTFSRFLHSQMPSHVVDCDHTHEDTSVTNNAPHHPSPRHNAREDGRGDWTRSACTAGATETTALLDTENGCFEPTRSKPVDQGLSGHVETGGHSTHSRTMCQVSDKGELPTATEHLSHPRPRPSMMQFPSRVLSFVKDTKRDCDETGPCYGYSGPCGQECDKQVTRTHSFPSRQRSLFRQSNSSLRPEQDITIPPVMEGPDASCPDKGKVSSMIMRGSGDDSSSHVSQTRSDSVGIDEDVEAQHHHHVPSNAFMDLGLQTSIAIGLHKLPEGFIMFATNHANPKLGFNVFFALFIHNITEGFSMALPLYLAFGVRWKAMLYSSVLGGLSQPLGASIAAVWFAIAGGTNQTPGHVVYGCLFACVAGIMAAVAMILFSEGLSINHSQNLCTGFALLGMLILGASNALTA